MTLVAGDERFAPLANALRNVCVYAVFPDTLREPQKPDTVRPMKQARGELDHDSPRNDSQRCGE